MEVQESNAATSLTDEEGESKVMEVQEYTAAPSDPSIEGSSQVGFEEQFRNLIATESIDFDSWTSIISETETTFPDNIENISLVYDSFLSEFPLCHLYWKRYADHNTRLCGIEKAVEIFERAVKSAPHSVSLWVEYCSFSMYAFEDPFDIRWLFKRGISYVGKDYLCHTLWDRFIEFECSQEKWSSIAHLFIQTLRSPTRKLHVYYKNFKKFTTLMEMEMNCENNCTINEEAVIDDVVKTTEKEIYRVIKDLEDSLDSSAKSKALKKYVSIGEQFYREACLLDEKIHCYEDCIKRSFFHVKPLDDDQLAKWHQYLDFIEKQDDFEWAVKLYERCLIICANYPEFWMRYVEFMESNGGRELANSAVERATQVFLKDIPVIRQFSARFKEKIGDLSGARAEYHQFDSQSNSYVESVIKEANMETRLGNLESASAVYEKALKVVAENHKLHNGPVLYVQFSRLKYMITGSSDAAIDVIIDGIQHIPSSRLLVEELIKFAMIHEGSKHLNKVDCIVANAISPRPDISQGMETKDREDLSRLYTEFVDLWGTNDDIRKAWNRHINFFPNLIRTSSYNNPILSNQCTVKGGTKRCPFFMPNLPSAQNHAMSPDRVSTQDPVRESQEDPMDSTHDSVRESQEDPSKQRAGLAEATQLEPENLSSDSPEKDPNKSTAVDPAKVDKESDENQCPAGGAAEVNTIAGDDVADEDAPPPGFSHPQAQTAQIPAENSQAYNQMLQSYYQQQIMQQQLLQLQPYLQQQQQHEQMMVQHQQYQSQGGSDPVQQQQYMLYMHQQQYMQQYQQQQYQHQLAQHYNLQYEQMLQQQQQQQQIPLSYYQQGQGIIATSTANVARPSEPLKPQQQKITQPPPTAGAHKLPVSSQSRLQSPPASSADSKSRNTRSQSSGHKSPKNK